MKAVKDINTLKVGDTVVWYNGPLTFKEKVVKMKDGRLAVRGIGSSFIPLTSLRLDLFKESKDINTTMENTESLLEAARKIVGLDENVDAIAKMVATLKVGDNTNFGKVVDISNNSITFKAKDLPKTKIAFNQRKIGSSEYVLSALTKLNEARGYKSLTPAELIAELQSVIDLPNDKLNDVTRISMRVSREEIHKRYPEIYKMLEKMYDAVMKPNGAKETKNIAQKAIEIVRSKYPNADKYQRMAPIKEKYRIGAGHKDAVNSLMKCERYFSPNSNLAKSIIDEFGEGYKKDFAEMEKYIAKVISLWEGVEMEIAMEN